MSEVALADYLPYLCTVAGAAGDDDGVLVTPAMDYVGFRRLSGLDIRYLDDSEIAQKGEALRALAAELPDGATLQFLYRVSEGASELISEYEGHGSGAADDALRAYVADRAAWLRTQPMVRREVHLCASLPTPGASLYHSPGLNLLKPSKALARLSDAEHQARLEALGELMAKLTSHLAGAGVRAELVAPSEIQRLHYALLNPGRGAGEWKPRIVRDQLFSEDTLRTEGESLREYSESEQLIFSDVELAPSYLRFGDTWRRTVTLKTLPEGGTHYFNTEPLFTLHDGSRPFPFWLAVTLTSRNQERARRALNAQHTIVGAMRNIFPFLDTENLAKDVGDAAKRGAIRDLFEELQQATTKICDVSVSVVLDASSWEELQLRTEAARQAFKVAGNSELLDETYSQLPAWIATLPGGGPYAIRKKGCTSRNAADLLPLAIPTTGTRRAASVTSTPYGEPVAFDFFDKRTAGGGATHGVICGRTGAGKSVQYGALVCDAIAQGSQVVLVDNGRSWEGLTQLFGGTHIEVNLSTSISPFQSYPQMLEKGEFDNEALMDVVTFLEVCTAEEAKPTFDNVEKLVVSRAIRDVYEQQFRSRPDERPVMSHFRNALLAVAKSEAPVFEREIAEGMARRLALFCGDELYGKFLDRPSNLRFDSQLLTFEMEAVSKQPLTKAVAMATVMRAILARASARRTNSLVAVDEAHEYLGSGDTGGKFIASCYRVMRKYGVSMWLLSQALADFIASPFGQVALTNSAVKLLLQHEQKLHDSIAAALKMPTRTADAFRRLELQQGVFSDVLVMYGTHNWVMRSRLHPFAYWLFTTDPADKELLRTAGAKNPHLSRLQLLQEVAARYPQGASGPRRSRSHRAA